jgi:hypothetical protein
LPFRELVLRIEGKAHFTGQPADRWQYYVEQNGLTPIHSMAHRIDMLTRLDLRPSLPAIAHEVLLLQGDRDKIVPAPNYHLLLDRLANARGVLMAGVGHQPHFTHPEWLAREILAFLSEDRSAELRRRPLGGVGRPGTLESPRDRLQSNRDGKGREPSRPAGQGFTTNRMHWRWLRTRGMGRKSRSSASAMMECRA